MAKKNENGLLENIDPEMDLVFYGIDLNDDKAFNMFIKKCEFLCRKTVEYEMWAKRTKALAINQNSDPEANDAEYCPICKIQYQYAPAESHHHPITLFNLCVRQFQEWVDGNELPDKRPLDLIQEDMEKHLCDEVEHVVLCKHCHEKYHNGEININNELQKIIDYKRSKKFEAYPNTIKENMEIRRNYEKVYSNKRREEHKKTFQDIHSDITKDDILGSIFSQIGEREFLEEQNIKKEN